jgi:hypothetical protein
LILAGAFDMDSLTEPRRLKSALLVANKDACPPLVTWPYWNRRLLVQEALSKTQFIRYRVDGFGHDAIGF